MAPMKSLVRERIEDWKTMLEVKLWKKVVKLTSDVTPDVWAIANSNSEHVNASTLCPNGTQTPPKWTTLHNSWQNISNTSTYLRTCTCLNLVPKGHTDTPQTLHNCWQKISNTNLHLPTALHTGNSYLKSTSQLLSVYIPYHMYICNSLFLYLYFQVWQALLFLWLKWPGAAFQIGSQIRINR